jgi:glycerophosphoryl diester phosphodiesterase
VTPRFVEEARAAGDAVWVYVVDDVMALRRLRGWGVAGCLTTRPAELIAALAQF